MTEDGWRVMMSRLKSVPKAGADAFQTLQQSARLRGRRSLAEVVAVSFEQAFFLTRKRPF